MGRIRFGRQLVRSSYVIGARRLLLVRQPEWTRSTQILPVGDAWHESKRCVFDMTGIK
jgi:hypothetical protein